MFSCNPSEGSDDSKGFLLPSVLLLISLVCIPVLVPVSHVGDCPQRSDNPWVYFHI